MGGLINILVIPESAQITARQPDFAKHVYTALHLKYWNVLSVYIKNVKLLQRIH